VIVSCFDLSSALKLTDPNVNPMFCGRLKESNNSYLLVKWEVSWDWFSLNI